MRSPGDAATRRGWTIGALLLVGAVACSGNAAGSDPQPTTDGPSAQASRRLDPNFDSGQEILIQSGGFTPHWLVAVVNNDITFVNRTERPVRIEFANSGTKPSGPIPPGGSWSIHPTSWESIAYHAASDPEMKGLIQVEPQYQPGETPWSPPPTPAG